MSDYIAFGIMVLLASSILALFVALLLEWCIDPNITAQMTVYQDQLEIAEANYQIALQQQQIAFDQLRILNEEWS